jgi:hypothetical protein
MFAARAVPEIADFTPAKPTQRACRNASAMSAAAARFDERIKQEDELSK